MTAKQHKVLNAIAYCRTAKYGYHVDQCDRCGHRQEEYNSCRDRHCPKCQGIARKKWVTHRIEEILPVAHYHIVFTLPHLLHDIICLNRRLIYNLLFKSSAATLLTFGRDPKWLGGEIGFYGILHTWGQTLWQHPHVHYIVPGGGLHQDGRWVEPPHHGKFLFPVHALSKVFRGKFIEGLKNAYSQGELSLPEACEDLKFERFLDSVVARNWVVYCKPPFGDAEEVVSYIGRYTHRVAISNHRIEGFDHDAVRFRYKDYRHKRRCWREMGLAPQEFIRRFLWHVLPPGFHKIRHYGFLANGRGKAKVAALRAHLNDRERAAADTVGDDSGIVCPECGKGKVRPLAIFDCLGRVLSGMIPTTINKCGFDTS
jgi:hypothetical protein